MANYIRLPNGAYYEATEGQSPADAFRDAYKYFPQAFGVEAPAPTTKSGLGGAFGKGLESLLSSGQTAAQALMGSPEEAAKSALARGEARSKKYEEQVSWDKVKKAYEEQGVFSAAKEALGQVPAAIAEQAPNIASTLGSARLGATAGSVFGPAGTVIGGVAGAAAPSLISQFGGNIERQAAEQQAKGESLNIDRGAAAAAALPQAALDVAGTFIPLGGQLISKLTGIPAKALTIGAGNATKLAEERLLATLAKGTAVGAVAEIPTEITQQMLERAQAGLSLTDSDALAEYGKTAYQVGLLAPIGGAGRLSERGAARDTVAKQKADEAAKAAQEAEAAKNAPEALAALDDQYRAAMAQRQQLEALVATKPTKASTVEEKKAYVAAKQELAKFNGEFKPLEAEYQQRKEAIDALYAQQAAQMEAETAGAQPTAAQAIPNATALPPVTKLMDQLEQIRNQIDTVETQLAAGPSLEEQEQLQAQRQALLPQLESLGAVVTERGGVAASEKDFLSELKAAEKKRLVLLADGKFDDAAQQATKVKQLQAQTPLFETMRKYQQAQPGETLALFSQEQAPTPAPQTIEAPETTVVEAAAPAAPEPKAPAKVEALQTKLDEANAALPALAKAGDAAALSKQTDEINKIENELSTAQNKPRTDIFDLFSPANIIRTAMQNNDEKLLATIAAVEGRKSKAAELDKTADERTRVIRVLDTRLGTSGTRRTRTPLFESFFDAKEQAKFKNGTNFEVIEKTQTDADGNVVLDKDNKPVTERVKLQDIYDKGGAPAVEYEMVMQQIEDLKKQVETRQRNAKKSLLAQAYDLAAEHAGLTAQMESGIATPTLREKTAALNAKQGKGKAPEQREMNAGEKHLLQRKLDATLNKYNMVLGKIAPVREQIIKLHQSLYETKPVAPIEEERGALLKEEGQRRQATAAAVKAGTAKTPMSRTAQTAARINRGDVRKEAETSEKMRDLAKELGRREPGYRALLEQRKKRLDALVARYGKDDDAVNDFKAVVREEMEAKALELGKKTPEYKATLKEQIAYFQEVLPTAGKQVAASKRTPQVTRKATGAPKELRVAGSRMSDKEIEQTIKDSEAGTAFRVRSAAGESIDPAQAQAFIDKVQAGLPENVKFVYAADPGKISIGLLKRMSQEGVDPTEAMVQGAVFSDGTVLIVGDQHTDLKDLEATVAHELFGHYGIDTMIGTKRLQEYANKTDLLKLAEDIGGADLLAEMQQVAASNAALGRSEEIQKLQVLREIIAHTEETRVTESFRQKAGRWLKELVGMVRASLRDMGFTNMAAMSNSDIFYALKKSRQAFADKKIGAYRAADGQIAFRTRKEPVTIGSSLTATQGSVKDRLLGNFLGLTGRVQLVDQHAALSEALKQGLTKGQITSLEAGNAEYSLRFGQQNSQYAGQFLTNGAVELVANKTPQGVEYVYKSKPGVNMMDVAKAFAEAKVGNDAQTEAMATLYLAGKRAKQVGWEKLNFDADKLAAIKADYAQLMAVLNANQTAKDAFEEGSKLYQKYNAGLLDFLVQTGALKPSKAAELKAMEYVPFYRVDREGNVDLMVDKETPVRISNIKDEPQLKELVGGNTQILPLFTSSVQNTFMITRMGLRNQAIKESAFALRKIGIASRVAPGKGPAGTRNDVVRFKKNGEDHYALIDTDLYGIPADLIVKGMEGIKTTIPAIVKMMGYPADVMRKFVTRSPTYVLRQMVRDPLNAWLTTGTDATPVLSAMKELGKMIAGRSETEKALMASGAISSNVFTGDQRDMAKFLADIAVGKSGWEKNLARADAFAMRADAATRAVVYNDSLAKGMSEQQALLRTLESMNFSRKGLSPSMQMLSTMIPFFNAQIQGLDVLYRAFKGQMPYSEQLKIKEKLYARGMMLAVGTMAYAALMSDDEAYKRAKPEERYGNWFVYIPGVSEPVRVPIPFELGYLFKSLPEAIWNVAQGDEKASKAAAGIGKLLAQSNPFALPQAVKPLTEAILGKSFYGGDIESVREKGVLATDRYRDSSTEIAKLIGRVTGEAGVSAITIDHLIRGYTGPLGIALMSLANPILSPSERQEVAAPSTKLSKLPFFGGLFQPVEGRGTLDEAYDRMEELKQIKGTFNSMVEKGQRAEAKEFAQRYSTELALATTSGQVQKALGEMAKQERAIRASPNLTTEQKDAQLEKLDKMKTNYARKFIEVADRTKPQ
jgi:hypothetical protein